MPPLRGENGPGIYMILNRVNGKAYVGSASASINKRRKEHWRMLGKGCHSNRHLQRAWDKDGPSAFVFRVLEFCGAAECLQKEQHWLEHLGTCDPRRGYNIRQDAASNRGIKWSDESRARLSLAQAGRKAKDSTRATMSLSQEKRWARAGAKEEQSARLKGRTVASESAQKISRTLAGRKLTSAHKESIVVSWQDPVKRQNRIDGLRAAWKRRKGILP